MLFRFLVFVAVLLATTISESQGKAPAETPNNILNTEEFDHLLAYQGTNFGGFYPRQGLGQYVDELGDDEDNDNLDDDSDDRDHSSDHGAVETPLSTPAAREMPTRTRGYAKAILNKRYRKSFLHRNYVPRQAPPTDEFTYSCPTDVQCSNGGCCSLGDYCAIENGMLGCCP
ncbi:hypothetical protein MMC15_006831, partial [Xylographa vitiligo]|nr:hypothetical protein [Xylographa vitiligo]